MYFDKFLFYIFFYFSILSSLMVISLTNPVHSVLFLILTFCNIIFLLLLLGAEFFSFLLLIVYVGAIAVLFLFVIMMLNIKLKTQKINFIFLIPIVIVLFFFLNNNFYELVKNFDLLILFSNKINLVLWLNENYYLKNIEVIGYILYTDYFILFLISSLILLVAMIGVIVLTMHQKINLKKQKIEFQLMKNSNFSLKFLNLRKS